MFFSSILSFVLPRLCKIFLLFGRQKRFIYAIRLIKIIEPLLAKFSYYAMPTFGLGNYREYLTMALLHSLTYNNIEFDPVIKVNGADLVIPNGAIFITGHFFLNYIFMRWIHDQGRQLAVFLRTGTDEWRITGTKVPFEIIEAGATTLIRVKSRIAAGNIVAAAIDNPFPYPNWKKLNVSGANIFVADSLIRFAERAKIPIFYFDTYFDENDNVVSNIMRASSQETAIVLDEFAEFISGALKKRIETKK